MNKTVSLEEFEALPDNKKRVVVAKDALARIKAGKFYPERNVYLEVPETDTPFQEDAKVVDILNDHPCQGCALGAILAAYLNIKNGMLERDANGYYAPSPHRRPTRFFIKTEVMVERLKEIFSPQQMILIESAFERKSPHRTPIRGPVGFTDQARLDESYRRWVESPIAQGYYGATESAEAILRNIIENDGEFVL